MSGYKSLDHISTVIVVNNKCQLFNVLRWCDNQEKRAARWMYAIEQFPVYMSVCDDVVGLTYKADRALYYKPFLEFLEDVT